MKFIYVCSVHLTLALFLSLFIFIGGGTLFTLEITPDSKLNQVSTSQWTDGLFDVVWSESDANTIVTASGDGTLQLWNLTKPEVKSFSAYFFSL